MIECSFLILIA